MIGSIKEIYSIHTVEDLEKARDQFDDDLNIELEALQLALSKNILSKDVVSTENHMTYVGRWRDKVSLCLRIATAFVEYAKSYEFLLKKVKGISDIDRDAYRRKCAGGFVSQQQYLENLLDSIDEHVNMCKRALLNEMDGHKLIRHAEN